MSQLINFRGATTAGLFTYLAIYAGLLGYATVAFDKKPESAIVQLTQPVKVSTVIESSVNEVEVISAVTQVNNGENESLALAEVKQQSPEEIDPVVAEATTGTEKVTAIAQAGKLIPVQQDFIGPHSAGTLYPDSLNAQLASVHSQQMRTASDHAHHYNTNSRGNGRSRGAMNGDGDFSFSMKFKSRAQMNADSEVDGSLQNAYYADQYMNYWQQQSAQPVYRYYYQ